MDFFWSINESFTPSQPRTPQHKQQEWGGAAYRELFLLTTSLVLQFYRIRTITQHTFLDTNTVFKRTMDGLSAAASIIAVIQVAQAVGSGLKDYYEGVRDAREDIDRKSVV